MRSTALSVSLGASLCLALAACNFSSGNDQSGEGGAQQAGSEAASNNLADTMASTDGTSEGDSAAGMADFQQQPTMQLQVVLDRLGFTPGVVDGEVGSSTRNALEGFQEANGLAVSGELDTETKQALEQWRSIPATRMVTIPADFAQGPFQPTPESAAEQAKMDRLGYTSLDEKLAERFHTTVDTLAMLNSSARPAASASPATAGSPTPTPSASASSSGDAGSTPRPAMFRAGQQIRVPNVGADQIAPGSVDDQQWLATLRTLGVGSQQPGAERIVVSKSAGTLKVFDKDDKLIGMYTATMGSTQDPLPLGDWKVNGVAHNPPFEFDPDLFWDVPDSEAEQTLPPGPNGPVGVVWIDLSKEHYGIHGTPEPQTIGRAESHGCVRLTNWDAARLAQMVSPGTKVLFES